MATGTHLMLINTHYRGFGDVVANPWSVLMVTKHVLVLAFLALAVLSERAFLSQVGDQKPEALKHFRWALTGNAALGAVILLLIAIAQAG